jgi:hypothetical protein
MNSLQILAILSYDKVEELRDIFHISKYYSLLYESEEYDYITVTSKRLFLSPDALASHLLLVLSFDNEKEIYAPCCNFNRTNWTKEKVKKHFLKHKHYTHKRIIYRIIELDVAK